MYILISKAIYKDASNDINGKKNVCPFLGTTKITFLTGVPISRDKKILKKYGDKWHENEYLIKEII